MLVLKELSLFMWIRRMALSVLCTTFILSMPSSESNHFLLRDVQCDKERYMNHQQRLTCQINPQSFHMCVCRQTMIEKSVTDNSSTNHTRTIALMHRCLELVCRSLFRSLSCPLLISISSRVSSILKIIVNESFPITLK